MKQVIVPNWMVLCFNIRYQIMQIFHMLIILRLSHTLLEYIIKVLGNPLINTVIKFADQLVLIGSMGKWIIIPNELSSWDRNLKFPFLKCKCNRRNALQSISTFYCQGQRKCIYVGYNALHEKK